MSKERSRRLVVILTLITTIVAAVVAGLQVEADTQADAANRQSESLVLHATSHQISDSLLEGYEMKLITGALADTQEGLALDIAALKQTAAGEPAAARLLTAQANSKRARAARARELSDIYQDPALSPTEAGGLPNVAQYFGARNAETRGLVEQQNQSSTIYNMWSSRSGTYVAILSVLAVTFFLLGLAQIGKRMRPFLAACGAGMLVVACAWAIVTAVT